MFLKLFTTSDGKIPFIQIALGAIIGAIGVLIYVRFYKPKILFPDKPATLSHPRVQARPPVPSKRKVESSNEPRVRPPPGYNPEDVLVGAPVVLDLDTLHQQGGPRAPELPMPAMFPPQEEPESEEEEEDDEEGIDEDEILLPTGQSGISELP